MRFLKLLSTAAATGFIALGGDAASQLHHSAQASLQVPVTTLPAVVPAPVTTLPAPLPAPVSPAVTLPAPVAVSTWTPANCVVSWAPYWKIRQGWRPRPFGGWRFIYRAHPRRGLVEICAVPSAYVLPRNVGWFEQQWIATPTFWPVW